MPKPWYIDESGEVKLPFMMVFLGGKFRAPEEAINAKTGFCVSTPDQWRSVFDPVLGRRNIFVI
jgi:hypothetical protein